MGCSDSRIIEETHKEMYRIIEISHEKNDKAKDLKLDLSKIKSEKEVSKNNTSNIEKSKNSTIREINPKKKISSQKTTNLDLKNLYLDVINRHISSFKGTKDFKVVFKSEFKLTKHPYQHVIYEKNKNIFFNLSSTSNKKEDLENLKEKISNEMQNLRVYNYQIDEGLFIESKVSENLELNTFKKEFSKTSNAKIGTNEKSLLVLFRIEFSENVKKIYEISKLKEITVIPIITNQINSKDDFEFFKEKIVHDIEIYYINSRNCKLYANIMEEINQINSSFNKSIDYNTDGAPLKSEKFDYNSKLLFEDNYNFKCNLNTINLLSSKVFLLNNFQVILNCNLQDLNDNISNIFDNISYCSNNCSYKSLKNIAYNSIVSLNQKIGDSISDSFKETTNLNKSSSNKNYKENDDNENIQTNSDQEDHLETTNLFFSINVSKSCIYTFDKNNNCLVKQKNIISPIFGNISSISKKPKIKMEDLISGGLSSNSNNYKALNIINVDSQVNTQDYFYKDLQNFIKNKFNFIDEIRITQNIKRKVHLLDGIIMTKSIMQIVDFKSHNDNVFDEIQNFNDIYKGEFKESKFLINCLPTLSSKFDSKKSEKPKLILLFSLEDEEENISQINFINDLIKDIEEIKDKIHFILFNRFFDQDDLGDYAKNIIDKIKEFKISKIPSKLKKIQINDQYHSLYIIITTVDNEIIYEGSGFDLNIKKTMNNLLGITNVDQSINKSSSIDEDFSEMVCLKKDYYISNTKFKLLKEKIKYYIDKMCLNLMDATKRFYKPYIEFSYNRNIDDNKNKNYHKLKITLTLSKEDYLLISKEKYFSKFQKILKDNNCLLNLDYSSETRKISLKSKNCSSCSEVMDFERNGFYDQNLNKLFCYTCESKLNDFGEKNFYETNLIAIKCNNDNYMDSMLNGIYSQNYVKYINHNSVLEPIDDTICSICNNVKLINEKIVWLSMLHFYNDYNLNENFIFCDSNCGRRFNDLYYLKTKFGSIKNLCKTKSINSKFDILNKISEIKEFLRLSFNELEIDRILFNNFDPLNNITKKIVNSVLFEE